MRDYPALPVAPVDTTGAGDVFHGAYALAIAAVWLWVSVMRNPAARHLAAVAPVLVIVIAVQMVIGIATLLGHVPFWLALAHQGFIVAVIAACIELWARARFAPRPA